MTYSYLNALFRVAIWRVGVEGEVELSSLIMGGLQSLAVFKDVGRSLTPPVSSLLCLSVVIAILRLFWG